MDCRAIDGDVTIVDAAKEDSVEEVIEGLDSYMDDLNDRLAISRMVSNSVIRAMARAIEEKAAEEVAAKDVAIARLRKELQVCRYRVIEDESLKLKPCLSVLSNDQEKSKKLREALEQFEMIQKEADLIMSKVSSNSDFSSTDESILTQFSVTLGEVLQKLKATSHSASRQVDGIICLCEELKLEKDVLFEVESMVLWDFMLSIKQELGLKFRCHVLPFENRRIKWSEKVNEISKLYDELGALLQLVCTSESGRKASHECVDFSNNKKIDHSNCIKLNLHASSPVSVLDGKLENGDVESKLPESLEASQLKHMSKDDLYKYFKDEILKMKRDHESKLQQITEDNFKLKRELLRQKESFTSVKGDTDVDVLRKGLQQSMSKLKSILLEYQNWDSSCIAEGEEGTSSADHSVNDMLTHKDRVYEFKEPMLSGIEDRKECPSLREGNFLEGAYHLEACQCDTSIEAFVQEGIYKCWLKEAISENRSTFDEASLCSSNIEGITAIVFREAVHDAETILNQKLESAAVEYAIIHQISDIVYGESIREVKAELYLLNERFRSIQVLSEMQVFKADRALNYTYEEKEKLKNEVCQVLTLAMENDITIVGLVYVLKERNGRLEHAYQCIRELKECINQQKMLILDRTKEFESVKAEGIETLTKNNQCLREIKKLNIQLEMTMKMLEEVRKDKYTLLSTVEEKQNALTLAEVNESKIRKNFKTLIVVARALFLSIGMFEDKVLKVIEDKSLRLEISRRQLNLLIKKANTLAWTVDWCKKVLEKKDSDLKKAESEVDILADQVDALLFLIEKIYVGLNHYSAILQHYPGIMDVLNLVKRELRKDSGPSIGDGSNIAAC